MQKRQLELALAPGVTKPGRARRAVRAVVADPAGALPASARTPPPQLPRGSRRPTQSTLIEGDSLEASRGLPAECLDAIYIDPPFGTGRTQRGRSHSYRDVDDDPEAFVAWLRPWLVESHRVLKTTGSLFVHLDYRAMHYVKVALDALFGRHNFVNEIVWCYAVGGKSRRGFARKHDTILWYAKTDAYAFYPDAVRVARRAGSHMRVQANAEGLLVQQKTDRRTGRVYSYPVAAGKIPEDWWTDIETLNHSDKQRTGWPSQKPERLLERIICATTQPGDWVADWFGGSGTTAAVAARLGRSFVLAEREPQAVALAAARLVALGVPLSAVAARDR